MTRNKYFLSATVVIVSTVASGAQSESLGSQIDYFAQAINTRNIGSVEIFGVPRDALFRTNVTPERLDDVWDYKIVLRDLNNHLELHPEDFTALLKTGEIQPSATKLDSVDVRFGFIFFAKRPEGKRIASIYFDRNGRHGAFNNISTSFGPDFLLRLKKALHAPLINSILYSFEPVPTADPVRAKLAMGLTACASPRGSRFAFSHKS